MSNDADDQATGSEPALGPFRSAIAAIGAAFIYLLIRVFGRRVRRADVPWLDGPVGGDYISDRAYEECAAREGLAVVRNASEGGLIPELAALDGPTFDSAAVRDEVRHFYEHTARYRMDMWGKASFPASIALWLLVTTISRSVNQLNFPLRVLDAARGMDSEIVLLREPSGDVRYTGWYRRFANSERVIYTGFYMTQTVPWDNRPCVKVVFPMPGGNATVILQPAVAPDGTLRLSSTGEDFGDAGFYRVQACGDDHVRVWRVRTLKEDFAVYVDRAGALRCDHGIRFLGLPVLHLHYRMEEAPPTAAVGGGSP